MNRSSMALVLALLLVAAGGSSVRADVRADEKTRMQFSGVLGGVVSLFGGKAAREGVTTAVAIKGDRRSSTSDATGEIVDLAEEKIYKLDIRRKTYTVKTFAQIRQEMEDARRRAEEQARKDRPREQAPERDPNAKEMEIDFDVKNTGQTKSVNGFDTHQAVLTITVREKGKKVEEGGGLVLTSDMWVTPTVAAMKEVGDFARRFAEKLQGPTVAGASPEEMATMMAAYPGMKDALAKMSAEGSKLEGTPIMTTMTFDVVKSADQVAQEAKPRDEDKGSVGGLLGGLARRARRGQDENKPRTTFMTSTNEVLKISTSVSATDVAVPSGFREDR